MTLDIIWKVAVTIFAAGGFVSFVRQMRKDVNGLGGRVRSEIERRNFQFLTQVVSDLTYEDDLTRREKIGKMHLDAGFPEGRR